MSIPRTYLYDIGIIAIVIAMMFAPPMFYVIGGLVLGVLAFMTARARRIEAVPAYSSMIRMVLVGVLLGCVTVAYLLQR